LNSARNFQNREGVLTPAQALYRRDFEFMTGAQVLLICDQPEQETARKYRPSFHLEP
jgi:hypothetical protein